MTDTIRSVRPDFFGKDQLTPFVGQVEDVNDPKMSHRVKVRCVGWHPKAKDGEDGLPTEDLPWARVGMPTTHAQTSRIGGKHGLLPGSWVFGFFLDGDEANDPFILSTFNMTAKAATKDIREKNNIENGRIKDDAEAFTNNNGEQQNTNVEIRTTKEQEGNQTANDNNDPAAATHLSDADGTKCGGKAPLKSAASQARQEDMKTETNASGQPVNVNQSDGRCGSVPNAQRDSQIILAERLPSQLDRFKYGDMVWNNFSGKYMNLNGIINRVSNEISNNMKALLNSEKAVDNEKHRQEHSEAMKIPDRTGNITEEVDVKEQEKDDAFNGIFQTSFIDELMTLTMGMVQGMDNQNKKDETGDNLTGNTGTSPDTLIMNPAAEIISVTLMNNFKKISIDIKLFAALEALLRLDNNNDEEEDDESYITKILNNLSPVMQFPLKDKYAQMGGVMNKVGDKSQSKVNKDRGCREERFYNTELGTMGATFGTQTLGGFSSGAPTTNASDNTRGSSGSGSTERSGRGRLVDVEFGGLHRDDVTYENTNVLGEESRVITIKDPGVDAGVIEVPNPNAPGNIVIPNAPEVTKPDSQIIDFIKKGTKFITIPAGERGRLAPISQASIDEDSARNFVRGVPNQIIVLSPGERYFFNNTIKPEYCFPSVFIKGYRGTPVPVVDKRSGEMVAILTNQQVWDPEEPTPGITLIPDNSGVGITTDNPDYDIVLGGFFVANTGKNYTNPTIRIIDKDRGGVNGEVAAVMSRGRIVDVQIINTGSGFLRIPEVLINDVNGYGAKLYPIMSVVPRPEAKPLGIPVQMIACPTKNQTNLY